MSCKSRKRLRDSYSKKSRSLNAMQGTTNLNARSFDVALSSEKVFPSKGMLIQHAN